MNWLWVLIILHFQVRAEDKDEGYNGQVEYSITKGGDDFSINPSTGDIRVSFQSYTILYQCIQSISYQFLLCK